MRIEKTKQNQNSFKGHLLVDLEKINADVQPKFLRAVKKEIGNGVIPMSYRWKRQTIQNDIFVGIDAKTNNRAQKLIIATGLDDLWQGAEPKAKIRQIDYVILNKIESILTKLGVDDEPFFRHFVTDYQSGMTGQILDKEKHFEIILDKRDYLSSHYYKKLKGRIVYDYECQHDFDY